ncbi:hypothetical protein LGL08_23030 [Clostridium estertheticum]|uniref:hypothetical protein n=1 Tax=Clostridium estertheticum TaxID=238834 RepID=UPI001CF0F4B5|nr:hypothetical protein [Clostridium estertheticum]MCB2309422.1 hypothetical protein [Clostridium estertheticum]MCB2347862.1 hypothetical protein [Clostridium estertheticum]MCB2352377.1 hypothetical protein [Clostridium estertheticum]WAG48567.1 hypothetical protein LL127_23735 [Clostridium estertheticum]
MSDVTPPEEGKPEEGNNTPPVVTPPKGDENNAKMNEMIALQMKTFQENLMTQLNGEYTEKLNKLNDDNSELEDKKQRLAVAETLRASNMDGGLIDFVFDKDPEIVKAKIKQLDDLIKLEADRNVMARFKAHSYIPPNDNGGGFSAPSKDKPKYFV